MPCPSSENYHVQFFEDLYSQDSLNRLLQLFDDVDFDGMSCYDEAAIRFMVLNSSMINAKDENIDLLNFQLLLKKINQFDIYDCKLNYIKSISNLITESCFQFPNLGIQLVDDVFNSQVFDTMHHIEDLKQVFLINKYNSLVRLGKYKEATLAEKEIIKYVSQNDIFQVKLSNIYQKLSYTNHETLLKEILDLEQFVTQNKLTLSPDDSIGYFIVMGKVFRAMNLLNSSKDCFGIALKIAINNKAISKIADRIPLLKYESALSEINPNLKIKIFEDLLTIDIETIDYELVVATLEALSQAYGEIGEYEWALKTMRHCYDVENQYNEKVSRRTLLNLAFALRNARKYDEAYYYARIGLSFDLDILKRNFLFFGTDEKQMYWNSTSWSQLFINQLCTQTLDSIEINLPFTYNYNLFSKSLLLESSLELDQAISKSQNEELKLQFAEMKQLRSIYSKMISEGSALIDVIDHYKNQADSLDKILVNEVGEYAAFQRKFEVTWKDVRKNLAQTEAAIEFVRYYDNTDSSYKYMALVVCPDFELPRMVYLGSENLIKEANNRRDFAKLYKLVWSDVDNLLEGIKTVYYSPSGELNNVPFAALCKTSRDSLDSVETTQFNRGFEVTTIKDPSQVCNEILLDKYTLHQLTTTRYLADCTSQNEKPLQLSIALLGGINFDDIPSHTQIADIEPANQDYTLYNNMNKKSSSADTKKYNKRNSSGFGMKFKPLPGSKEEVIEIDKLLKTFNWQVQTRTDKNAGEYEFKKELETKAPGVLHIATHGFAFPDEVQKESKLMDMNQTSTYKVSDDPMVRCGLMLSGSNISWTGNPKKMIEQTGDDGILTAAEVANIDLSQTKLVVLSACETGLGKIEGSEGTFGLKRGFKLAGVEQIIVSLWSVPDKETMELMTLFYTDLAQTLNPVISFEKAQKEMRNRYPTEPDKWAGFVLVR